MFSKGPPVRTLLLVALFLFSLSLFALDDEGQLNDDPGAIDSNSYNEDAAVGVETPPEAADVEMDQTPEHAEYPVEETHQVLRYVQDRADAPKYSRGPQIEPIPGKVMAAPVSIQKHPAKKPLKIKKKTLKKVTAQYRVINKNIKKNRH